MSSNPIRYLSLSIFLLLAKPAWAQNNGLHFEPPQLLCNSNIISNEALSVSDLDADGMLDIIGNSFSTAPFEPFVCFHDGQVVDLGNFDNAVNSWHNITVADVNSNSSPDIIMSGYDGLSLFRNLGNREFSAEERIYGCSGDAGNLACHEMYVALTGDFNNDGFIDVAGTENRTNGTFMLRVLLNNGNGGFPLSAGYSVPSNLANGEAVAVPINEDNFIDVAATASYVEVLPGGNIVHNVIEGFINNGAGQFPQTQRIELNTFPFQPASWNPKCRVHSIAEGDIDGDGDQDLIAGSDECVFLLAGGVQVIPAKVFILRKTAGSFQLSSTLNMNDGFGDIYHIQLLKRNDRTHIAIGGENGRLRLFFDLGNGTYNLDTINILYPTSYSAAGDLDDIFYADWNGDGEKDLIYHVEGGLSFSGGGLPPGGIFYQAWSPNVVSGPQLIATDPSQNYVDPRADQDSNGNPIGLTDIYLTLSEPVVSAAGNPLSTANFHVAYTWGGQFLSPCQDLALNTTPTLSLVSGSGAGPYHLRFHPRIPLGCWTRVGFTDIKSVLTNIPLVIDPATSVFRIGSLPIDINNNGVTNAADVTQYLQYLNNIIDPAPLTIQHYLDQNRDGNVSAADVTRTLLLLNGQGTATSWASFVLGTSPP